MSTDAATYKYSMTLDKPAQVVWDAITKKDFVDQYYLAPLMKEATQVGDDMAYGPPGQAMIVGHVLEFNGPHKLVHTFRFAEMPASEDTKVTYTLKSTGDKTELHLKHTGLVKGSQFEADVSGGWPIIMDGLKTLLEKMPKGKSGRT